MGSSISFLQRLPLAQDKPWVALVSTLILVGVGYLIRISAMPVLPVGFPYVTFFPVVVFASFLFGLRQGILAAILCGIMAWYFLIPPFNSFAATPGKVTALIFYTSVVVINITLIHWMQRANAGLAAERETSRALAENRELLFLELQHRVSNNLQVVAALLSLQKQKVSDPAAKAALDEAARRLSLIGRISRQLYDPAGATLGMKPFLEALYKDVVEANGDIKVDGTMTVDDDIMLAPDMAIPLALIFTESLTNSIEHGFAGRGSGRVDVHLGRRADKTLELVISDDGQGLPAGFTLEDVSSLGLRIATTLAQNLNGVFSLEGVRGTTARLVIPA